MAALSYVGLVAKDGADHSPSVMLHSVLNAFGTSTEPLGVSKSVWLLDHLVLTRLFF